MSDPEVSDVHQSEGEAEEGTPLPRRGQPESRVFGSSLSCGNVCRASPWLWRDSTGGGCWGPVSEVLSHEGFRATASSQNQEGGERQGLR